MQVSTLRDAIRHWLTRETVMAVPIAWKWQTGQGSVDYAAALHGYHLQDLQSEALVHFLQVKFPLIQNISFENGYLNFEFRGAIWVNWIEIWLNDPSLFIAECHLPIDLAAITEYWPYRMLKVFHEAATMVLLPNWSNTDLQAFEPTLTERKSVKLLLAIGGILHQKAALHQKRLQMMTMVQEEIAAMWQLPILIPHDPVGSAGRRAILQLALIAAETIGAPSKQSLAGALQLQK